MKSAKRRLQLSPDQSPSAVRSLVHATDPSEATHIALHKVPGLPSETCTRRFPAGPTVREVTAWPAQKTKKRHQAMKVPDSLEQFDEVDSDVLGAPKGSEYLMFPAGYP